MAACTADRLERPPPLGGLFAIRRARRRDAKPGRPLGGCVAPIAPLRSLGANTRGQSTCPTRDLIEWDKLGTSPNNHARISQTGCNKSGLATGNETARTRKRYHSLFRGPVLNSPARWPTFRNAKPRHIVLQHSRLEYLPMKKRVALATGVVLTAASIILTAFGAMPTSNLLEPKIIIIVAFVLLGTIMQLYGAWPRRRSRYFTNAVWMERPSLWRPTTDEPKAKPKSVPPNQRRRKAPSARPLPSADGNDAPTSH